MTISVNHHPRSPHFSYSFCIHPGSLFNLTDCRFYYTLKLIQGKLSFDHLYWEEMHFRDQQGLAGPHPNALEEAPWSFVLLQQRGNLAGHQRGGGKRCPEGSQETAEMAKTNTWPCVSGPFWCHRNQEQLRGPDKSAKELTCKLAFQRAVTPNQMGQ